MIGAKFFNEPKKFNPSKATPLIIEESPMRLITLSSLFSLARSIPAIAEIVVEE